MERDDELIVDDAAAWRRWLDAYESTSDGVWLVLAKKGATAPTRLIYGEALDEALCSGWIDGPKGARDAATFHQRFTPRRARSMWSARNVEHIARLADQGRLRPRGQDEVDRARADGRWDRAYAGSASRTACCTAPRAGRAPGRPRGLRGAQPRGTVLDPASADHRAVAADVRGTPAPRPRAPRRATRPTARPLIVSTLEPWRRRDRAGRAAACSGSSARSCCLGLGALVGVILGSVWLGLMLAAIVSIGWIMAYESWRGKAPHLDDEDDDGARL
ncbi:YdeI/OmpD-associated family protein [Microbacterium elymi]|uniref:YdeI/OmpD-associated family protein n=1 Tax=Microbacterium elymi TaxID=2909587 RepID=UPI003F492309